MILSAALRDAWLILWVPTIWLFIAASSLAVGWAVRRTGVAWALVLGGAFACAVGLGQATMWGPAGILVQQSFAPLIAVEPAPWAWVVASGGVYAGLGVSVLVVIRVRLRRWLSRVG